MMISTRPVQPMPMQPVRFGQLSKPEVQQPLFAAQQPKRVSLLGFFLGAFLACWGTVFCGLGVNAIRMGSQVNTVLHQSVTNQVATIENHTPSKGLASSFAVMSDRHVMKGGVALGFFTEDGKAYTADGRLIGHVDDKGNMYSSLLPNTVIAVRQEDGTIDTKVGLKLNNALKVVDPDNQMTPKEEAAAALIIVAHPDNNK